MTLAEIIDTRPGDRLQGPLGWRGTIFETTKRGVVIAWDGDKEATRCMRFTSDQWPRISKLEDE